ncbi:hypothetical protein BD626DRAFT_503719 [Schizophyllum amplum]|uniref:Uncharacterized protein n=1 Tax=Schizophyllum amplum TaxID=97359 RepID=A0A550C7J5_9AGAR|nr:hypothetical protein BD626DRAFT_503719 [Auriculariopsis ampla]
MKNCSLSHLVPLCAAPSVFCLISAFFDSPASKHFHKESSARTLLERRTARATSEVNHLDLSSFLKRLSNYRNANAAVMHHGHETHLSLGMSP